MFLILVFFFPCENKCSWNKQNRKAICSPDHVSQCQDDKYFSVPRLNFFFFFFRNSLLKQISSENYFNVAEVCLLTIQKENTCFILAVLSFPGFIHKGDRSATGKEIQNTFLSFWRLFCTYRKQHVGFSLVVQTTGSRIRLPGFQYQIYHSLISCEALEVISSCLSFFTCRVGIL